MTAPSSGYSAHVALFLVLNGRRYELGQVGPEHCVIRNPQDFPPSPGEIVMIVDGDATHLPVFLPNGGTTHSRKIPYRTLSSTVWPVAEAVVAH